ncbi:heterokaryon incompatibility protein-domain-containing protein [Xylogone sp. PMI_703]|nr:heterokaryon incompatibility protein-domain-containing protein [Xylogone sp. PMI_703]
MRLLNSSTHKFKEFMADNAIPPYAILSHTWGDDEISFEDWYSLSLPEIESKEGFEKLKYCLDQASLDKIEWLWIDTCCIDKRSSAELSEAINTMFRWYQNAHVGYVYLVDFTSDVNQSTIKEQLHRCRWFTRGWCLQELIAPKNLIFYSKDWRPLGTKFELCELISSITSIDKTFLLGGDLETASVAKKMSWAARRETTRIEDTAYCLLGIFGVHMPLIYGEGKNAFHRLQAAILEAFPYDHTLFAWGKLVKVSSIHTPKIMDISRIPRESAPAHDGLLLGLFAESPKDFASSGSFVPSIWTRYFYHLSAATKILPTLIGKGVVRVELPWSDLGLSIYQWKKPQIVQSRRYRLVYLFCSIGDDINSLIGLPLQGWGYMSWGRTEELIEIKDMDAMGVSHSQSSVLYIEPALPIQAQANDIIVRNISVNYDIWRSTFIAKSGAQWIPNDQVLHVAKIHEGELLYLHLTNILDTPLNRGVSIIIGRVPGITDILKPLYLRFVPIFSNSVEDINTIGMIEVDGIKWVKRNYMTENDSLHHHIMKTPYDRYVWTLNSIISIDVCVQVERMPLDNTGSSVDVVDIIASGTGRERYYGKASTF